MPARETMVHEVIGNTIRNERAMDPSFAVFVYESTEAVMQVIYGSMLEEEEYAQRVGM